MDVRPIDVEVRSWSNMSHITASTCAIGQPKDHVTTSIAEGVLQIIILAPLHDAERNHELIPNAAIGIAVPPHITIKDLHNQPGIQITTASEANWDSDDYWLEGKQCGKTWCRDGQDPEHRIYILMSNESVMRTGGLMLTLDAAARYLDDSQFDVARQLCFGKQVCEQKFRRIVEAKEREEVHEEEGDIAGEGGWKKRVGNALKGFWAKIKGSVGGERRVENW